MMASTRTTKPSATARERATDAALTVLRTGGQRVTPARRAIIDVLASTGDHLSADDIIDELAKVEPDVHRATVYRTLDSLVHLGVINHVHLPHGAATYHLAGQETPHHLHLVCGSCDAVVDAPSDLLDDAARRAATTLGFRLDPDHVALTGWCRDCADDIDS